MKTKSILISILILVSALRINAQGFKFGILAGIDMAKIQTSIKPDIEGWYVADQNPMISFNINGYAGFKSNGFWGISIEPGFIQKGGIWGNSRNNRNYIQIPLLADLYFTNKLFLSLGPEIAFLINKDSQFDNVDELSGLIGFNYTIMEKIDLGLRYNHAFSYTFKHNFPDPYESPLAILKLYNQYFQLIIRYKF